MQMLTDTTYEVTVAQQSYYHLPVDVLIENNSTEDITQSNSTQETTVEHNINHDYATNRLESANGSESPLLSG